MKTDFKTIAVEIKDGVGVFTMNMGLTAEKLFAQNDFTKEDMDKWGVRSHELAAKALYIDPDTVNVMGGGTAIGHALGATGARLTGTRARILNEKGGRYGCANACGGQGVATIIEKEDYDW